MTSATRCNDPRNISIHPWQSDRSPVGSENCELSLQSEPACPVTSLSVDDPHHCAEHRRPRDQRTDKARNKPETSILKRSLRVEQCDVCPPEMILAPHSVAKSVRSAVGRSETWRRRSL